MLKEKIAGILAGARETGWVMEPQAKGILREAGLPVPDFTWARDEGEAVEFAREKGFPLAAKVVSPAIVHKSDAGGVAVNIGSEDQLRDVMARFSRMEGFAGAVVEPMAAGVELIVGGKMDHQFGPVVLFGVGGTSVEIYQDTVIRMAPLKEPDADSMIRSLKGKKLLLGYRGQPPVALEKLKKLLVDFSRLLMEMEGLVESIDLNPVMCSDTACLVADARIMLPSP
ncbi:MAG: acetate--CoA ligase family protein [Pseudomonadota bacterium]